jgi:hypothetical protein
MRRVVIGCALMVACNGRPLDEGDDVVAEAGSESDTASEDTAATDETTVGIEGDTGEPTCYPLNCQHSCMRMSDECGEPMWGGCSDAGTCECEQVSDC